MSPGPAYTKTDQLDPMMKGLDDQLEQLERLRSENTLRRLMITHSIEAYWIPSQKKTKSKLQIYRICQNFKCLNFETSITRDTLSEVAW